MSRYFNNQSFTRAAAVTPSDTTFQEGSGLYVGGTGNIALVTEGGDTVTFNGNPVGSVLYLRFSQIKATGTTATNLIRLW